MDSNYSYISIEGNIGAGKPTATNIVAKAYNARPIYEQFEDIPFLPLFYKEPLRYAFALEMSFLHARYEQLRKQVSPGVIVADYHLGKCLVFAENNLNSAEFSLYKKFYNVLSDSLPKPDLVIYLEGDVDFLQARIKKRGRSYEQDIKADYLLNITSGYHKFVNDLKDIPVLILKLEDYDLLTDELGKNRFLELISEPHSIGVSHIFL